MIRKVLAALAYELAVDAMNRADTAHWMKDFIRHRGRSRFWSDVEHSLLGLGKFSDLRAARRKAVGDRAERRRQPRASMLITVVP